MPESRGSCCNGCQAEQHRRVLVMLQDMGSPKQKDLHCWRRDAALGAPLGGHVAVLGHTGKVPHGQLLLREV